MPQPEQRRSRQQSGSPLSSVAQHWEARYRGSSSVWSGRVNQTMADAVAALEPGSALELGCGEGGDAVWLAQQGWRVCAVDISPTALERGRAAAGDLDIDWQVHDLADGLPDGRWDLVTASFLQSTVDLPRTQILRAAAEALAPGGHLVVVAHAEAPPWAGSLHHHAQLPTPESEVAALALDDRWQVARADRVERAGTGPDGQQATLVDSLVLVQRKCS